MGRRFPTEFQPISPDTRPEARLRALPEAATAATPSPAAAERRRRAVAFVIVTRRTGRDRARPAAAAGVAVAAPHRHIGDAALGVQDAGDFLVVAVEVGARLQVAGVVGERG